MILLKLGLIIIKIVMISNYQIIMYMILVKKINNYFYFKSNYQDLRYNLLNKYFKNMKMYQKCIQNILEKLNNYKMILRILNNFIKNLQNNLLKEYKKKLKKKKLEH